MKSLEEVKYQLGDVAGAYHSYSEMLSMKPSLGLKAANKKCRVVSEEGRDGVKRNGDKDCWEFSLFFMGCESKSSSIKRWGMSYPETCDLICLIDSNGSLSSAAVSIQSSLFALGV